MYYIAKTSSAVLRTMNERGSDWTAIPSTLCKPSRDKNHLLSDIHCVAQKIKQIGKEQYALYKPQGPYRWPKPDKTVSRFLTASMNDGTLAGLIDQLVFGAEKCGYVTYLPMEISIRITASFAPPVMKPG